MLYKRHQIRDIVLFLERLRDILRWRYLWKTECVDALQRVAAQQKSARFHGPFYP